MEEALLNYLRTYATLTALIAGRSYWSQLPQGQVAPYLILSRVTGVRDTTFDGASGLVQSRIQFDAYSLSYLVSKTIVRAVEARLSGKRFTHNSHHFRCFMDSERDTFETDATPDKLYRTSVDFIIWHKGV